MPQPMKAVNSVVLSVLLVGLTSGCVSGPPPQPAVSTAGESTRGLERPSSTERPEQTHTLQTSLPGRARSDGFGQARVPKGERRKLGHENLEQGWADLDLRPSMVHFASFDASFGDDGAESSVLGQAAPESGGPQATPGEGAAATPETEHGSLAEVGAKLSNPVSNVWALYTEFLLTFNDGDLNNGDAQIGGTMLFQPVLPIPLTENLNFITRPTVPFLFGQPVPKGPNEFNHLTGFGDIVLPLVLSPKAGNWLLGAGPTFTLPTSTHDELGRRQWTAGPAAVAGYKTKDWILGIFSQYFWGIGSRGDQGDMPDASFLELQYFAWYNLPDAWQFGASPTVSYDDKATSGNKWNVPVGLMVAKTIMAGFPLKIQVGVEYSVVGQDDFGEEFVFKVNLIPVVKSFIQNPVFGG